MKKIFGGLNLTWSKVIIMAILVAVYTAVMAMLPITSNTSFRDIAISFEVWILFGIIIIMNSKSAKDSALKCFIFFLISQPLIYLLQVPFSWQHWHLFSYYKFWFIWTLLCIPMGFVGYFMKKDKWWSLLILIPILIFLGIHYNGFLGETVYNFPYHLLSALFCIATMIIYPICIFNNKKIKLAGLIISLAIIAVMTFLTLRSTTTYNTTLLVSGGEESIIFDDTYKVYLEDDKLGKVYIEYDKNIEDYMVNASFKRAGKTNLIVEDSNGNKTTFEIDVKRNKYDIKKN